MKWILVIAALAACGAQVKTEENLADSIRQFNEGIRWGRFEVAASSIPAAQRGTFVDEMDQRANDVKITDYEVVKVEPRGPREARVQIKLTWYKDNEGTVHETHSLQTWERHGKLWMMVDEARVRGTEMPGLAEPAAPAPTATN